MTDQIDDTIPSVAAPPAPLKPVWKSAQLLVAFRSRPDGSRRPAPRFWPPRAAWAALKGNVDSQRTFVELRAADGNEERDLTIELQSTALQIKRAAPLGWRGIRITEDGIALCVGDAWITINADGSLLHDKNGAFTEVAADGAILRSVGQTELRATADGQALTRITPNAVAAVRGDSAVVRQHAQPEL